MLTPSNEPERAWREVSKRFLNPEITSYHEYFSRLKHNHQETLRFLKGLDVVWGLDPTELKQAHECLFQNVYTFRHAFRREEVAMGSVPGAFSGRIAREVAMAKYQLEELIETAREKAEAFESHVMMALAFYHARLIYIQPFLDRNKLLARTVLEAQVHVLTNNTVEIPVNHNSEYVDALNATLGDDLAPLANFLLKHADCPQRFTTYAPPFRLAALTDNNNLHRSMLGDLQTSRLT